LRKSISFFIIVIIFNMIVSVSFSAKASSANQYVYLEVSGPISEKKALFEFMFPKLQTVKQYIDTFEKAGDDSEVGGIILHISDPQLGWAKLHQLRRGIKDFRKEGKKVYAFLSGDSFQGYLLACACDQINLAPSSSLMMTGLRVEAWYFKDLLSRLGMQVDVVPIGKYKNAAETFTSDSMSETTREMLVSIMDDFQDQIATILHEDRGITTDSLQAIIDEGPYTALEAVDKKLVDSIKYEDEIYEEIEEGLTRYLKVVRNYGKPKPKAPEFNFFSLLFPKQSIPVQSEQKRKIAYIVASGTILPGERSDYPFDENVIAADELIKHIHECAENDNYLAIILRVESPGGSAAASDLIWRELMEARKEKAVVASLSNVAASGGYYIAMGADKIIAEPGTITGSIGVISAKLVIGDTLDKIGIKREVISYGKNSGMFSAATPFSDSERAALRKISLDIYDSFVTKVAESRNMDKDDVLKVAEGRVWTGRQAKEINLVDQIGGIEDAISLAKKLAGISPARNIDIEIYPRQLGILDFIQEILTGGAPVTKMNTLNSYIPVALLECPMIRGLEPMIHLFKHEMTLTVMPQNIEIR